MNLKDEEARERSRLVRSVQYTLGLVLPRGGAYCGTVEIRFVLSKPGPIFVDYSGSEAGDIIINGFHVATDKVFSAHRIKVPAELQQKGENIVSSWSESVL